MKQLSKLFVFLGFLTPSNLFAQNIDTNVIWLHEIEIKGYKTMNGTGHIDKYSGQTIFSGKKNEVLSIDSLTANKAVNNTRQIIGRVPGVNIIETEGGGFTANGIGFRGLNPYQSIEMNTRQNGYNISADIFGYNEAYYLPPMEAVGSIQFLRGAAGLQFGPQLGGLVNYIIKDAPLKPIEINVAQTTGSDGLFSVYTSVGGTLGKWQYFSFCQNRYLNGWRTNSDQQQISGFGKIVYNASPKTKISLEYSLLRNKIHMPGGLNDSEFIQNPKMSLRARNWLQSPWNIITASIEHSFSANSSISFKSTVQFSERDLIWQNEDSWYPNFVPDSNGVARELEKEYFKSITNELRFLTNYKMGSRKQTFACGIREATSLLERYEGGIGTSGSNLDFSEESPYETAMKFRTTNISFFTENIFQLTKKFSITPGFRYEYLTTSASGLTENKDTATSYLYPQLAINNQSNSRQFLLTGISAQYDFTNRISSYCNFSQSYRPITYSNLTPFGTTARIDKNLKDVKANNFDLGLRGKIKNYLIFDASVFGMYITDRIGNVAAHDGSNHYFNLVTNTGSAVHYGFESYSELAVSDFLYPNAHLGRLSVYNSFAYIHATYSDGFYKGNQVEYAPRYIEKAGLSYSCKGLEVNLQYAYQSKSFGDADNTSCDPSAETGILPNFFIADLSASYKWSKYKISFGVNNFTNEKYFTLRTSEYPGPGIIPSTGRMVYGGLSIVF